MQSLLAFKGLVSLEQDAGVNRQREKLRCGQGMEPPARMVNPWFRVVEVITRVNIGIASVVATQKCVRCISSDLSRSIQVGGRLLLPMLRLIESRGHEARVVVML